MLKARLAAVLGLSLLALSACAGRVTPDTPAQGQDFTVEVVNSMPHAMNVSYELGTETAVLGSVDANQTRRFTIPNRGADAVRLVATDQGKTHRVDNTLELDSGDVTRWEIK
jgi:hypothetical protein